MRVEKNWEARFDVSSSIDRTAVIAFVFLLALGGLFFFPVSIFLLPGILADLSIRFILRKLGRKPLPKLGIAAIAISVSAALFVWWSITWGKEPFYG